MQSSTIQHHQKNVPLENNRGVGLAYPDQVQTKGKRTTTWMRTSSYKWIYNHRVTGVISKLMGACTGCYCHGYNLQPWIITPTAPPTMHHQLGQLGPTSECEGRATYQATPATSGPTKFEHPTGFKGQAWIMFREFMINMISIINPKVDVRLWFT